MAVETSEASALATMQTTLVAMQVQQGRIESTLNIVVTQHERRIEENSRETRQLRVDLDAVKDNANKRIDALSEKHEKSYRDGSEKGNEILRKLDERITNNTNGVTELRDDVNKIWNKLDSSTQRVVLVISPLLSGIGLLWAVWSNK